MRRREFIAGVLLGATTQAHAQQRGYRIALIHPSRPIADMSETGSHPFFRVLFAELRRLGFVEGENLTVERYSAEGQRDRYAEIAREVVRSKPDVVFAITNHLLAHFRGVAIPITGITNDPIGMGLVTSLARPGGNITGVVADAGFGLDSK